LPDFVKEGPLVGLTTTIPSEIVFAAGMRPIDLNNIFINSRSPEELLESAENQGFPRTLCAWIKGIFSTVINQGIDRVIAVTGGDCSNTIALAEVLRHRGVKVHGFDFPLKRNKDALKREMLELSKELGAPWDRLEEVRTRLDIIREKLRHLDRMTYIDNVVTGLENHLFLVTSSDFGSDPDRYEEELDYFLEEAAGRKPLEETVRLGFVGVPPIFSNLYEVLEEMGARVVFNEVQRQFSIPSQSKDLVQRYLDYTYPYDIGPRLQDVRDAISERTLDGIIHYTQTFCHRQIHDILIRNHIDIPVLTLEGDRPGSLDGRTITRLETFLEMLGGLKT
jgi:benzoyl-CoA reductase/2-hydroxyglutaryl-CoA dehydratase subunit BcrC/BadD/HgdB